MALIHKLFGRNKTLSKLTRQELRKEEILLGKQRDRLLNRIEQIAADKQKIFQRGAAQKSPDLRKALAMDFEMRSQEQLMAARELNIRSKELLTVTRLRMVRENQGKSKALGRLNVTDRDIARITQWIEDDAVSQEMYQDRLNAVLEAGEQSDKDAIGAGGVGTAGQELLNLWDQVDQGKLKQSQALQKADELSRQRGAEGQS
jgi:hypothetical protein